MKNTLIAGAIASLLIAPGAKAGEFFIGVNAGTTDFGSGLNDLCEDVQEDNRSIGGFPIGCTVTEDSDTVLSINGGYNFNRVFGIEVGYTDLGEYEGEVTVPIATTAGTVSADFIYGALVLSAPFTEKFSASLRLGGASADAEVSTAFLGAEIEDEAIAFVGASLDYRLTDNLSLQARYDNFEELTIATGGIRFHF